MVAVVTKCLLRLRPDWVLPYLLSLEVRDVISQGSISLIQHSILTQFCFFSERNHMHPPLACFRKQADSECLFVVALHFREAFPFPKGSP